MSNVIKSIDLAAAMSDVRPEGAPQPQARNNDNNRVARATLQSDGTFAHQIEGTVRTTAFEAARGPGDVWDYALDSRTKSPLSSQQVKGDSIIKLPGKPEVTLDDAIRIGWLTRPTQGGTDKAAAPQGVATEAEQQAQQEPLHPDLQTEPVGREAEEAMTTLTTFTSALTRVSAVEEMARDGEISERNMAAAASEMGVEPSQVQTMIDKVRPELEAQANNVATALGVDPEAVWDWANEAKPREMREAISRHLTLRNTHGYQKLAQEYVRNLDTINPDMILNAQVAGAAKVSRAPSGQIYLTTADGKTWGVERSALGGHHHAVEAAMSDALQERAEAAPERILVVGEAVAMAVLGVSRTRLFALKLHRRKRGDTTFYDLDQIGALLALRDHWLTTKAR